MERSKNFPHQRFDAHWESRKRNEDQCANSGVRCSAALHRRVSSAGAWLCWIESERRSVVRLDGLSSSSVASDGRELEWHWNGVDLLAPDCRGNTLAMWLGLHAQHAGAEQALAMAVVGKPNHIAS